MVLHTTVPTDSLVAARAGMEDIFTSSDKKRDNTARDASGTGNSSDIVRRDADYFVVTDETFGKYIKLHVPLSHHFKESFFTSKYFDIPCIAEIKDATLQKHVPAAIFFLN